MSTFHPSSGLGALVVEINTTHPTQDIMMQPNKIWQCSTGEIGSALKKRKFRTGIIGGRKFKSWCQYFLITGGRTIYKKRKEKAGEDFPIIASMSIVTVCRNCVVSVKNCAGYLFQLTKPSGFSALKQEKVGDKFTIFFSCLRRDVPDRASGTGSVWGIISHSQTHKH